MQKALTEIHEIADKQRRRYPDNSTEFEAWDRVHLLSGEGDARTLSDDPTVAARKRRGHKTPG